MKIENAYPAIFVNAGESAFMLCGAGPNRELDAFSEPISTVLLQDDIQALQAIAKEHIAEPCVAYSWAPLEGIGYRCEIRPCITVGGDVVIFNARPGSGPEEYLVRGNGCISAVLYSPGSYTTFNEAERVKPVALHVSVDELPKKYRKVFNRPNINLDLYQELVEYVDKLEAEAGRKMMPHPTREE